eukprot:355089-Chlamydomonas_euryale.AAC.2
MHGRMYGRTDRYMVRADGCDGACVSNVDSTHTSAAPPAKKASTRSASTSLGAFPLTTPKQKPSTPCVSRMPLYTV